MEVGRNVLATLVGLVVLAIIVATVVAVPYRVGELVSRLLSLGFRGTLNTWWVGFVGIFTAVVLLVFSKAIGTCIIRR